MISAAQAAFLRSAAEAAKAAKHIFPAMAACEAADESSWGKSKLALQGHNLFGQKQQVHPIYGTLHIPTREFINHDWITEGADWVSFPDYASCFAGRMDTLLRLKAEYPHYALALAATTPEQYVTEVSLSWSTNPTRAVDCIAIFHAHLDLFAGL